MNIQVFIPMTGIGSRFQRAGYQQIKPLIPVNGKPMIRYVADLFPNQPRLHFICNQDHLETTALREILTDPAHIIIPAIPQKLGPVAALQQAYAHIDDTQPVIICYCDFYQRWNYHDFLRFVADSNCDGAVVCYQGFHPHLRHAHNVYASCQVGPNNQLLDIREKYSFTANTMDCPQSSGLYYFKSGALLKQYCDQLLSLGPTINDEYYVSCVYSHMLKDQRDIRVYHDVPHFCQWGTPADLAEYNYWQQLLLAPPNDRHACHSAQKIIPMAGAGKRFADAGYRQPKPCIQIDKKPMAVLANDDLPSATTTILVAQQQHAQHFDLTQITAAIPHCQLVTIDGLSAGQASSALAAKPLLDLEQDLMIGACDNGMRYDAQALADRQQEADGIIFTFRNHPTVIPNPTHYSYVVVANDQRTAKQVVLKKAISQHPLADHALVGAFWFKKARYFTDATEKMCTQPQQGEWYIDETINTCITMGLRIMVFEIDYYIGWGTPDDLHTYLYWRAFFEHAS